MKSLFLTAGGILALAVAGLTAAPQEKAAAPEWRMNATIIEACSCPMFCQCYFNPGPAAHGAAQGGHGAPAHFCRFNNAFKINKGAYGATNLDGARFWVSGDTGADFSSGRMDWAVVTFDKATTAPQREAIQAILERLYPVAWGSFAMAEGDISWTAGRGEAYALLDGGRTAEIRLSNTVEPTRRGEPVVIRNLKYWGATSNDGFVLMPSIVEAYRVGERAFEFKGTNGFMITLDVDSETAPAPVTAADTR